MVFSVVVLFLKYNFCLRNIQLFRERLSYKRRKAYATMSKVVMGKVFQRGGRKQHKTVFVLSPWTSSKTKLLLPIMPIGMVAYAFKLSWDNLCRNSCILMSFIEKFAWSRICLFRCVFCWNLAKLVIFVVFILLLSTMVSTSHVCRWQIARLYWFSLSRTADV